MLLSVLAARPNSARLTCSEVQICILGRGKDLVESSYGAIEKNAVLCLTGEASPAPLRSAAGTTGAVAPVVVACEEEYARAFENVSPGRHGDVRVHTGRRVRKIPVHCTRRG